MAKIVTRDHQYTNPLDQLISLPPDDVANEDRSAALGRETDEK